MLYEIDIMGSGREAVMSKISIQNISITKLKTDIIVNAANDRLMQGGGDPLYL